MTSIEENLKSFPRVSLTRLPTPLHPLPHVSSRLGLNLSIKRDDLTDLVFGGDKPRKLEYEVAQALARGADTLVTCGSSQSNHARLTTAAARKVGMQCAVVLSHDHYQAFQGNLLTVYLMGAQVHLVESSDHWDLEQQALDVCETLRSQGCTPYYIPVSGTTPRSCLGYVGCGLEIAGQVAEQGLRLDAIYVPFGTGGIFTGLLLALRAKGITCPLIGISVNRKREQCHESLERWWADLCHLLKCDPHLPRMPFEIDDEYIGREYGDPTEACLDAIQLLAQTEGILLDPVYSGKMMSGFLAHYTAGRWPSDSQVLLLHSGGTPALFAYQTEIRAHLIKRGISLRSEQEQ